MFFLRSTWMTILAILMMLAFTWCMEDIIMQLRVSVAPSPMDDSALAGHV